MTTTDARRFAPRTAPLEERFWSRVDRSCGDEACWEWLAYKTDEGYGSYKAKGFPTALAHRISYLLIKGQFDDSLPLDHLCRNRACVNPEHLEPVTNQENSKRSPLVFKSSCSKGHPYAEGSYYEYNGHRVCKECQRKRVCKTQQGRSRQRYVCEHCGEERNITGRSRHLKLHHPEHYKPREPGLGLTPERKARRLETQRIRRRKAKEERNRADRLDAQDGGEGRG